MLPTKYRALFIAVSVIFFISITHILVTTFQKISENPSSHPLIFILGIILFSYALPILFSWIGRMWWVSILYIIGASIFCLLSLVKTAHVSLLVNPLFYIALHMFLAWEDRKKKEEILLADIDKERIIKEKNILEQSFEKKSQALETFLHKYADYANLRKIIDDFSSTLSLHKLCELIVGNVSSIIGKGELVLLYLVDLDEQSLSLIASKSVDKKRRTKIKKGDIFDQWVLKIKQQLMVNDVIRDVRFDHQLSGTKDEFLSLLITPLIYEARIVGTLRINGEEAELFTTEDLRVLSIIGSVASAALSNAFLYQRTRQLAIKDSLTGLFVHRYFKERLKEEHKRTLITNAPLTLLMADLDDFKHYNDRYGHAAGDIILKKVSTIIGAQVKERGIVARYGGEEFAILLPKTIKKDGAELGKSICHAIAEAVFDLRKVETHITISIGVASIPENTLDSEELVRLADVALYDAKKRGKNNVVG